MLTKKQLSKKFSIFWKKINSADSICLFTHVEPDGDTLGSSVALKELIKHNTNVKNVEISGGDYPEYIKFLIKEPINLVSEQFLNESLKIVVDTSTPSRIFDKRVVTTDCLKIDHHPQESNWLFEIGGDYWPATGELIGLLAIKYNLKLTDLAKEAVATAILTDTEFFSERNISPQTYAVYWYLKFNGLDEEKLLKKLSLSTKEQSIVDFCQNSLQIGNDKLALYVLKKQSFEPQIFGEDILETLAQMARPLVGNLFKQCKQKNLAVIIEQASGKFRVELRSKSKFVNAGKIAKTFGGGGHKSSAGFVIQDALELDQKIESLKKKFKC